ncbi:MAG: 16S rRNA (cytosine(967)-C(5))-methyltransferase RsmB [Ignavibacteriae bacterium]|nr:16S rRNA (cytosine(967)-C(5))-methyltransferase RsmB [Ignavibacteriota bacterium]
MTSEAPVSHDPTNDSIMPYSSIYEGARGAAVRILSRFERSDSYLDKLLEYELRTGELSSQDKALLTELVNGTVRWWLGKLDWVLTGFYHGEFDKCLTPVKNAMRIALYQIMFLSKIPHPVAINESVEIVKRLKGDRSAGIVNGVLRNVLRHLDDIRYPNTTEDNIWFYSVIYSHPRWLVKRWSDIFGDKETEQMLKANVQRPILTLRVNLLKTTPLAVSEWLVAQEIPFTASPLLPHCFQVSSLRDIAGSEIFRDGWVSVQDVSASLAAVLAAPKENQTVIDLCAAPGGKTFYLAELMHNTGKVIALDKYEAKLRFIKSGSERLGLSEVKTEVADARTYKHELVDVVVADVPCSGHGTFSKKPDIKWKREATDITKLVPLQREILTNAATLVKPGGAIMYSTCTVEPEENFQNIEWFLEKFPNFILDDAENYLPKEVCINGCMQTFPHRHGTDGAFAARLVRIE